MEWNFVTESIVKLLLAVFCGFLLGLERKTHNHAIGLKTLVLICVSSALLSLLSSFMATNEVFAPIGRGDPTRIASGVISGIGFLGGGAIMKTGLNIRGLTSAAVIWTSASMGLAIGAGLYIQVGVSLFLVLVLLVGLERIEAKWFPAGKSKTVHLCYEGDDIDLKKIRETIEKHGLIISDMNMSRVIVSKQTFLHYTVKSPARTIYTPLIEHLKELGKLCEFSITD